MFKQPINKTFTLSAAIAAALALSACGGGSSSTPGSSTPDSSTPDVSTPDVSTPNYDTLKVFEKEAPMDDVEQMESVIEDVVNAPLSILEQLSEAMGNNNNTTITLGLLSQSLADATKGESTLSESFFKARAAERREARRQSQTDSGMVQPAQVAEDSKENIKTCPKGGEIVISRNVEDKYDGDNSSNYDYDGSVSVTFKQCGIQTEDDQTLVFNGEINVTGNSTYNWDDEKREEQEQEKFKISANVWGCYDNANECTPAQADTLDFVMYGQIDIEWQEVTQWPGGGSYIETGNQQVRIPLLEILWKRSDDEILYSGQRNVKLVVDWTDEWTSANGEYEHEKITLEGTFGNSEIGGHVVISTPKEMVYDSQSQITTECLESGIVRIVGNNEAFIRFGYDTGNPALVQYDLAGVGTKDFNECPAWLTELGDLLSELDDLLIDSDWWEESEDTESDN